MVVGDTGRRDGRDGGGGQGGREEVASPRRGNHIEDGEVTSRLGKMDPDPWRAN